MAMINAEPFDFGERTLANRTAFALRGGEHLVLLRRHSVAPLHGGHAVLDAVLCPAFSLQSALALSILLGIGLALAHVLRDHVGSVSFVVALLDRFHAIGIRLAPLALLFTPQFFLLFVVGHNHSLFGLGQRVQPKHSEKAYLNGRP